MAREKVEEVRIYGFSADLKRDLDNIADNIGIPTSSLIKMKLREAANSYPEKMRQPPKKY